MGYVSFTECQKGDITEEYTDITAMCFNIAKVLYLQFQFLGLAKALSVIATATWLGGWLGVRHTPVLYQNG